MAVSISSYTTKDSGASTVNSLTTSHTASTNLMVALIAYREENRTISSITWNTTENFTYVDRRMAGTLEAGAELWYLKTPTNTTANVVVSMSGAGVYIAGIILNIRGADIKGTTFGTHSETSSANSTSSSINVASVAGDLVIDIMSKKNSSETQAVSGSNTLIATDVTTNGTRAENIVVAASYLVATSTSTTMSWNWANNRPNAQIGIAIKPYILSETYRTRRGIDLLGRHERRLIF